MDVVGDWSGHAKLTCLLYVCIRQAMPDAYELYTYTLWLNVGSNQ